MDMSKSTLAKYQGLPVGYRYFFGIDPRQNPSSYRTSRLGGGPIPGYYAAKDPAYAGQNPGSLMGASGSLKANAGNEPPDWLKQFLMKELNQPGYNSQYESELHGLLNRQAPSTGPNPYTSKVGSIADQIANFRPSGQLPPEIAARLATMKSSALAGVDKQANRASDQLAGLLFSNTGGGEGSAEMTARASLANEIGSLRQGVESDFANRELGALNEYNSQRLAALQGGMQGYGAAGGFAGQDIDRSLGNFYNEGSFKSGVLDRLLSSERDRNNQRRELVMQLLSRYGG